MLQVFTGDGKGKTTAALGTAFRALAKGKRVGIVYFDKGGTHYSERDVLDWCASQNYPSGGSIRYVATGLDRIDPDTGRFRFGVTEEDIAEARRGLAVARQMLSGEYDLVILDEFNSSLLLQMIPDADGRALLDTKPEGMECICTGRGAPEWLKERADLVTEMTLVKHYFYQGASAREGLDY